MKFRNLYPLAMSLLVAAALTVFSIGCSGDDNTSTGPSASPKNGQTYDEITVALTKISVKYDCDFDPAGVTQPGDFRYVMNVDTLSDDGKTWLSVTKYGEQQAALSNGDYKNISGRSASFRFPRIAGQAFRVRLGMREVDPGGNDMNSSVNVTHIYAPASTQMYAPQGTNYTSWNAATEVGTMDWNVNKRDRSWVLGVLTVEGCNATLHYSVSVREVS